MTGKESDNAAWSDTIEVTACFVILEASDFRGTNASSGRSSQDPSAPALIGGTNILPLAQLLQNSMAGWTGPSQTQLEQFAQQSERLGSLHDLLARWRRLASGSKDTTVLVWDLSTGLNAARPNALTAEQLDGSWRDLAGDDAAKAYRRSRPKLTSVSDASQKRRRQRRFCEASLNLELILGRLRSIWQLAGAPKQSLPFLNARLRPIPMPDMKRISQLLADLDSEDFKVRAKAHEELEKFGEAVADPLRQTAEKPPSAEVGRRVKELLDKLITEQRTPSPERLRVLRAVEVLEHIGTPEACQILKRLANGAAGAQLTQEAKASLDRLAKRAKR